MKSNQLSTYQIANRIITDRIEESEFVTNFSHSEYELEEDYMYFEFIEIEEDQLTRIIDLIRGAVPENAKIIDSFFEDDIAQINVRVKTIVEKNETLTVRELIRRLSELDQSLPVYVKIHDSDNGEDRVVNVYNESIGVVKDDEFIREGISELVGEENIDDTKLQEYVRIPINSVMIDVIFDNYDTFYK